MANRMPPTDGFIIESRCGELTLRRDTAGWMLVGEDGRKFAPEDDVPDPKRRHFLWPAAYLVCHWLLDDSRTPEERIAAQSYLRLEERDVEEWMSLPTRLAKAVGRWEAVVGKSATGDDWERRWEVKDHAYRERLEEVEGRLTEVVKDALRKLVPEYLATEAAGDQQELAELKQRLSYVAPFARILWILHDDPDPKRDALLRRLGLLNPED
jgi:hypothetical protein